MRYLFLILLIIFAAKGFSQKLQFQISTSSFKDEASTYGSLISFDFQKNPAVNAAGMNWKLNFEQNSDYGQKFNKIHYPPRDSVLNALQNLEVELKQTKMHLNKAHNNLKWGLITSVIGYSIVVTGGVLGGTDNYADWGQPLIFTGGIIGLGGGIFVINGVNQLGKAGTP